MLISWFLCYLLPGYFFSCRYTVVGRSFFSPLLGQPGELGDGLEYWRGYYQSLRPTQMGLSLNIGPDLVYVNDISLFI